MTTFRSIDRKTLSLSSRDLPALRRMRGLSVLLLLISGLVFCDAQSTSSKKRRIESEFKLTVPKGDGEEVWNYILDEYSTEKLKSRNPILSSEVEEELFKDIYFDTPVEQLLGHQAGVRYRERYMDGELVKKLVQLKIPDEDSTGVIRREIKFKVFKNKKKDDPMTDHPFLQYVKPKDREEVDLHLFQYDVKGTDLQQVLKLEQDRKRLYIYENEEELLTLTLDNVKSVLFPFSSFTELELEVNEIRYTQAGFGERKRMQAFNNRVKEQIMERFPALSIDQTPKYNKMHQVIDGDPLTAIAENIHFIIIAAIVAFGLSLFFMIESRKRMRMRGM